MRERGAGAGLALAFVAVAGLAACAKKEAQAPPPPEVKAAKVLQRDVPVYAEVIGQTRGAREVEITARVEGFLESVALQEGSFVRKGQLLFTIDRRPFAAALDQAKGALAQAQAQLDRANLDVERFRPLVARNAIPRMDMDNALAQQATAQAAVKAARAVVERAELDLGYDALVAYQRTGEQRASQAARVAAERTVLELAELRYQGGVANYLEVLDAQRSLFGAELDESSAVGAHVGALVSLCRALGGGWPAEPAQGGGAVTTETAAAR